MRFSILLLFVALIEGTMGQQPPSTPLPQAAPLAPTVNRPALIGKSADAIINRIDTKMLSAAGQKDAVVMFSAVVDQDGTVKAPTTYRGTPDSKLFEQEILRALSDAKMIPALRHGEPAAVFYYGTAIFQTVNKAPRLRIFANQELKELAKEADFVGPQPSFSGDSKFSGIHYPREAMAVPVSGLVELALKIDADGNLSDAQVLTESPPLLGFGESALDDFRGAKFVPAFREGKAVACEITLPVFYQP